MDRSIVSDEGSASADGSTEKDVKVDTYAAEKIHGIRKACDLRDLDALVSYATSERGYIDDDLRKLACKSVS